MSSARNPLVRDWWSWAITSRSRKKQSALRLAKALAAAAAILLSGNSLAQDLVLAVSRGALSLPILVADDQGYFSAEGVGVRTQECSDGRRCLQLLLDGKAQLATATDLPIVFKSFERTDFAILATFASSARDVKLVTRKSAGITNPRQLEGKRIATVKGASAQYFLDSYLIFNDVDKTKVTVVGLLPEEMSAAMAKACPQA